MRRWPRAVAAVSFGVAGSVVSATWFLPSVLRQRDGVSLLLYIVAPGVAAALAGALAGAPLCSDAHRMGRPAALLRLAVLLFSALAFWWVVAAVGGAVGWLLHYMGRGRPAG